ncbi:MAG: SGNH/GDSL hydrolase family protein [Gemmatimonadaceae bacterium]
MTRKFLALGDSYTIGEGVATSETWPVQLTEALRALDVPLTDPRIIARTGWTTAELLAAVDSASPVLAVDYDLVSLLIGVNDQYRGQTASFAAGFQALVARAIAFGAGQPRRLVVVSIPDWGVTPFAAGDPRGPEAIGREIDELNRHVRHVAEETGAAFVDVTAASRRVTREGGLLAEDRLHPSGAMYASWVQIILPAARRALGR